MMMKPETIIELMSAFDRSSLSKLRIRQAETDLLLEKAVPQVAAEGLQIVQVSESADCESNDVAQKSERTAMNRTSAADSNLVAVKAPLVGTFYASPEEQAEPYVKVGDRVKKGQTLCILEAMKMMNEIPSPVDGQVVRIIPENEQLVGFDDLLLEIKIGDPADGEA